MMQTGDYATLLEDIAAELVHGCRSIAILGLTPVTFQLLSSLATFSRQHCIQVVYGLNLQPENVGSLKLDVPVRPLQDLSTAKHDVLVVAADEEKEDLLLAALPYVVGTPKVLIAGYGHLSFRDHVFREEAAKLLVPSLANGYPNSLIHLYQCLKNAARLELRGVVAEFGMFKGGTTMFLSQVAERLGKKWRVIGFDTFSGFPPRKNILDMYDNPDCVFTDLAAVRRYLEGRNIEIVVGDIGETCHRLAGEDVVLAFIDTDNYTPATAAINVVRERTVTGGAIVFDHFTGDRRFRYTLGERIAASGLLDDPRYFNLHGTGVFYRQR